MWDALKRINAAGWKARRPDPAHDAAATVEYLYVACARTRYRGSGETRRWVQPVPVVKETAEWIYYTSDSWDRGEVVVSPGRVSRVQLETGGRSRRGGPAGRVFFATREAAEDHLRRGEADRAASQAPLIRELRRAMTDAHPDRGGTAEQFIQARCRYQMALRAARA